LWELRLRPYFKSSILDSLVPAEVLGFRGNGVGHSLQPPFENRLLNSTTARFR